MGPIPLYSQPAFILWSLSYEGNPGKPLKFSGGEEPGPFRRVLSGVFGTWRTGRCSCLTNHRSKNSAHQ
jgi:hypothetical protein